MQEMMIEHYWMAGVMVVMAMFGGAAIVGYLYDQRRNKDVRD